MSPSATPAPERPARRRRHAASNDAAIHDISLRLLAANGVDGLSFSEMAEQAGLTRAPIYARYDSPEDVAADLWNSTLLPRMDALIEMNRQWYQSTAEFPSDELLREFTKPSMESGALVEVMAVARRFPYLQDLVDETVTERIEAYVASQDVPRAVSVTQLAILFGTLFLAPVVGPTMKDGWKYALPVGREQFTDAEAWTAPPRQVQAMEFSLPSPAFDDELLDTFVPAIMHVVARTGYANASANRIAREAGRAFNVVYERFDSKEDLMERAVVAWVEDGMGQALIPFVTISDEEFKTIAAMRGRSLVAPINRPFRNLRNEMTLAARHHRSIARAASKLYGEAARKGRSLFEAAYEGVTDEVYAQIGLIGSLVRSNGFGLSLLGSCTGALVDVDFTPAGDGHVRCIARRVGSHITIRES